MKLQFQIAICSVVLAVVLSGCFGPGPLPLYLTPPASNPTSDVFETLCTNAVNPAQCLSDYKDLCGSTDGAITESLDPLGVSVIETWCDCSVSRVGPNWDDTAGCTP